MDPALGEYACPTIKLVPNVCQWISARTAGPEGFFSKIENMGFLAVGAASAELSELLLRADLPGDEEEEDMAGVKTRAFLGAKEQEGDAVNVVENEKGTGERGALFMR